jgi:hypothetical protein
MKNNIKTVLFFLLFSMQSAPLLCMQAQEALQPVQQKITTGINTAGIHTTSNFSYSKTGAIFTTALISGILTYIFTKNNYATIAVASSSAIIVYMLQKIKYSDKAPKAPIAQDIKKLVEEAGAIEKDLERINEHRRRMEIKGSIAALQELFIEYQATQTRTALQKLEVARRELIDLSTKK